MSGPSGSGKSFSALLLASGLADWAKICVIDTENGSANLYDDLGEYNTITLEAPYAPERYIEAIQAAEKAGMEVIIVDSVTHEWDGKGGCLESNELLAQTKFKGNTWAAWSVTTPKHQKFLNAILTSKAHIITTARSKTDTIQTDDKKIKKVGLKEIQREGFEYELTANFTIDRDGHYAIASKDRTGIFIDKDPFVITQETGKQFKDWADRGVEKPTETTGVDDQTPIDEKTMKRLHALGALKGYDHEGLKAAALKIFKVESLKDLTEEQANQMISTLKNKPDAKKEKPQVVTEEQLAKIYNLGSEAGVDMDFITDTAKGRCKVDDFEKISQIEANNIIRYLEKKVQDMKADDMIAGYDAKKTQEKGEKDLF